MFTQFDDFSEAEIIDYNKYMGKFSAATRKKMTDNPWLARMWKEFKNDADFCPFGFQDGGGSDQRDPCINFDDFLKRCPDSPADFYAKFKEVFLVPGTDRIADPQKIESFLKDIDGNNSIFDEFKAQPELIKAWKFLFDGATIRTNVNVLEGISTALQRGAKSIPDVLNHANIPEIIEYTVTHIFRGHGSNGGRHHISALIADNSRKLVDRLQETADGFYVAMIKRADGTVKPKSFWPDTWDELKVVDEIEHAFGNKVFKPELSSNTWEGITTGGQKIRMFIKESDGSIISAFPVLD